MLQIVSFGVAALYSGMWCFRWARAGGLEGAWGQLGLFSGMVCVGSVVGAVAWAAFVQRHAFLYEAHVRVGVIPQQGYMLYASSFRFPAVFIVLNGVEFLCLIMCKIMLLGRLAAQSSQAEVAEWMGAAECVPGDGWCCCCGWCFEHGGKWCCRRVQRADCRVV